MKYLALIAALGLAACGVPNHERNNRTVYTNYTTSEFSQTPTANETHRVVCDPNISREIIMWDRALAYPSHLTQEQANRVCRVSAAMRW